MLSIAKKMKLLLIGITLSVSMLMGCTVDIDDPYEICGPIQEKYWNQDYYGNYYYYVVINGVEIPVTYDTYNTVYYGNYTCL